MAFPEEAALRTAFLERLELVRRTFLEVRSSFYASQTPEAPSGDITVLAQANHLGGRQAELEHWMGLLWPNAQGLPLSVCEIAQQPAQQAPPEEPPQPQAFDLRTLLENAGQVALSG